MRAAGQTPRAGRLTRFLSPFIAELDTIVTPPECETSEDIDDVLRAFIDLAAQHKGMDLYFL